MQIQKHKGPKGKKKRKKGKGKKKFGGLKR